MRPRSYWRRLGPAAADTGDDGCDIVDIFANVVAVVAAAAFDDGVTDCVSVAVDDAAVADLRVVANGVVDDSVVVDTFVTVVVACVVDTVVVVVVVVEVDVAVAVAAGNGAKAAAAVSF